MNQPQQTPLTLPTISQYLIEKVFPFTPEEFYIKHPKWPGMVGLELESFVIAPANPSAPVPLYGESGLAQALSKSPGLKELQAEPTFDDEGKLQYLTISPEHNSGAIAGGSEIADRITFEPGGQLEVSTRPYPCLNDASERLLEILGTVTKDLEKHGLALIGHGSHPWNTAESIGLQMTKKRYRAMNKYFSQVSPVAGPQMMRQTCTLQVNLDFGDSDEVLTKRFYASQFIAPYATAIFANSPFNGAELTAFKSFRSNVWRRMDASRSGFIDCSLDRLPCNRSELINKFEQYLLDANVVFIEGRDYEVPSSPLPFRRWVEEGFDGTFPGMDDLKTHLSLLFPEVRPRGFIEIRSIDSQMPFLQNIPAAFYTSLLYVPENLDFIVDSMQETKSDLEQLIFQAGYGLQNEKICAKAQTLFDMTMKGMEKLPECFQNESIKNDLDKFYRLFTARKISPADWLIDEYSANGEKFLDHSNFLRITDRWYND